ncbi:hypothetical protein EW146_g7150 [Bondarzewia mesenterica]|uniref:Retrovirus-related Pol polyprotein from transposon TNT 1-94-like beta-barrel domain-containing protein n=1 Tax=Bondarzewia mesenterica TaxID=1095465 RepID=A0A4S4LLL7_9AGAM|nr:hypothetical protein EW146_g7150 [Bondarzewia mesenterica]
MEHLNRNYATARSLWLAIRDEFIDKGIIAQNGNLTRKSLAIVIGLQALSAHYPDVRQTIQTVGDFSITSFRHHLEALDESRTEQSGKYSRGRSQFLDSTVTTTTTGTSGNNNKPHGPPPTCAHCGGRHISANCWATFGKPPEAVLRDRKCHAGNSSATAAATPAAPDNATRAPATPTTSDGAFIESAAVALTQEELDYFSCTVIPSSSLPTEHCSVDWTVYGPNCDVAAPLVMDAPYFFDSGSSCHISPSHDDLTNFTSISPRAIRGVNGSAVYALGQGSLRLRLGKGRIFVLPDVLFIPGASIRLISVGRLCNMGDKYSVQFDDQQCFVRHKTGSQKLVTTRNCTANNLYHLNGTLTPTSLLPLYRCLRLRG